jgi:hypothetical protein
VILLCVTFESLQVHPHKFTWSSSFRTWHFAADETDSNIIVSLKKEKDSTVATVVHSNVPARLSAEVALLWDTAFW